jgi:tetratricopeptide (TPR) repeat protein
MHIVDWQGAAQTALRAAEAEGDLRAQAAAQFSLGDSHLRQGRTEPAVERYSAALSLAERTGWVRCATAAIGNLGVISRDAGRLRRAVGYFDRGLELCRANGWRHGEAVALDALALAYLQLGRLAEAGECCARALAINRAIGSRLGVATALGDWGEVLRVLAAVRCDRGATGEAAELGYARRALTIVCELEYGLLEARARAIIGRFALAG